MEVALGCYLWGVWTVPWVSLPCPQHWSFPGFYGYADSCSLHCFYLLVTAFDLWFPYILNRIKGHVVSSAHGLYRGRGKKLSLLGITMCGLSTFPHSHPSPKMKTEAVFLSRGDAAQWWRARTHRQGPYLNFRVTNGIKNWLIKMKDFFLLFHQHFSPLVICSFLVPKQKQNQQKLVRCIESLRKVWERAEPPRVFNFLEPTRGKFWRDI